MQIAGVVVGAVIVLLGFVFIALGDRLRIPYWYRSFRVRREERLMTPSEIRANGVLMLCMGVLIAVVGLFGGFKDY